MSESTSIPAPTTEPALTPHPDAARALLRHAVATVAYRASKAVRETPERFADFAPGPSSRTPAQILAHMSDLYDWGLHMARGERIWSPIAPSSSWDAEVSRFFAALEAFDAYLAGGAPLGESPERLLQGPVADSLAHVGQLAMLRRLAGGPMRSENYARADIASGRTTLAQPAPRAEFD